MAPLKTLVMFACFLLVADVSFPKAQATIFVTAAELLSPLTGVYRIQGTLYCSINASVGPALIGQVFTPRFPNATIRLRSGAANTTIATTVTNNAGQFSFLLDPLSFDLNNVLSTFTLGIDTPLAACNTTLSQTANLSSALRFLGVTLARLLPVSNIVAVGFSANATVTA